MKIIASFIFLGFISLLTSSLFFDNFVLEPYAARLASYAALIIMVTSIAYTTYLYQSNQWSPPPAWSAYSKFKKIWVSCFLPPVIFWLFRVTIAFPIPYAYTALLGKSSIKIDSVTKDTGSRRRGSRYYILKPKSIDELFFRFNISANQYNSLPDGEMKAKLLLKKSVFGYIVEDIQLENDPH